MYKILIVCRDENMKNEIDSFLKGSYRTVILADDILQAEIISRTIRINFFIMVSAECYDSIRMIKAIKNSCLYKFTPIAVLNYSKGFNEDLKGYRFLYHIRLPLSKNTYKYINDLINHDISFFLSSPNSNSFITLNNSSDFLRLKTDYVLFFESLGHGSVIHTTDGSFRLPFTLKEIESFTANTSLYRCHRSYIINTENILRIDKTLPAWEIYFYGCNKTALVSRQNKREFAGKLTCQQESRPL